jgi:hypothetical protein
VVAAGGAGVEGGEQVSHLTIAFSTVARDPGESGEEGEKKMIRPLGRGI